MKLMEVGFANQWMDHIQNVLAESWTALEFSSIIFITSMHDKRNVPSNPAMIT
jgi:hypothetical protein